MSTTTVTRPAESSPGPSSRRSLWVVVLVGIAVAVGFILGSMSGRNTSMHLYTYSGTVDGVCGPVRTGVPRCFALTPDPGTAHADGYYAGAGDVSLGPPSHDDGPIHVGDHVAVTVVSVTNVGTRSSRSSPPSDPRPSAWLSLGLTPLHAKPD